MKRFAPLFFAALMMFFMACSVEQADLPSPLTEDLNVQKVEEATLTPLTSELPDGVVICEDVGVVVDARETDERYSVVPLIAVYTGKFAGKYVRPVNFQDFPFEIEPGIRISFTVVPIESIRNAQRFRKGIAVKFTCISENLPQ
jgi:hypothetical protein